MAWWYTFRPARADLTILASGGARAKIARSTPCADSFGGGAPLAKAAFHAVPAEGNIEAIDYQRLAGEAAYRLFWWTVTTGFQWVISTHFR